MASIRVTPETLSGQGQDLIGYAGDLTDILSSVDTKINEIIEGWDGLAQDAYFDMYTTMKESLDQFPGLVDALGQATTGAAEAFSTVDEELQSGFKSEG
ncbi:MAG: WXG100 family type VII secretion target [Eubacterium sp.]|nr:WXG100 family type VII secretion target [Eubacterium sp.]